MAIARSVFLTILMVTPLTAVADFAGLRAGGGSWQSSPSGELGLTAIKLDEGLHLKQANNSFMYVSLEHPLPVLPNIKIQNTDMAWSSTALISAGTTLEDVTFLNDEQVDVQLDLSHTDVTLYYQALDNVVQMDLGLTARMFDGKAQLRGTTQQEKVDFDAVVPLLYGSAAIDFPLTGLSARLYGNWMNASEFQLVDWAAEVEYEVHFVRAVAAGLVVGYRSVLVQLDEEFDGLGADTTFGGVFVALQIHI